jgi:hypothetical protein
MTSQEGTTMTPSTPDEYGVYLDSERFAVETWPRTAEGAITAVVRACRLSLKGTPVEVRRPDGRMLARYKDGRRADLLPGGIAHLVDAKAAGAEK